MNYSWILIIGMILVSCSESKGRRPVNKKLSTKVEYSVLYNKHINEVQDKLINEYIEKDTLLEYKHTSSGFAYAYVKESKKSEKLITDSSVLTFSKKVFLLNDKLLYNDDVQTVKLENSNLIRGIDLGLKLMQEGEEIKFIFSSFVAHGLSGDNKKIGSHTPIIVKIKLLKIN